MSRGIHWFKNYKIKREFIDTLFGKDVIFSIEYLDGNSTSFSEGNITKYQEAFEKYGNISIPYVEYDYYSQPENLGFIKPKVLSEVCSKILSDCILDKYDIKSRIEWFKEMSDKGYYFSFQNW